MPQLAGSPLAAWESFYVIVGSSAAALTGLMFVVIALVAEVDPASSRPTFGAFGTPTVVHFCAALLVAATASAPWQTLANCGMAFALFGVIGAIYVVIVTRRARRQTLYTPVLEDWIWHTLLPFASYAAYVVGGLALARHPADSLFAIGGATLLLVFIGIHNAWDTVTYVALDHRRATSSGPT